MTQIQADLRVPYSVDIPDGDLEHFVPEDPTNIGLLVTAAIGPKDSEGVEVFDFFVCTPRWLADHIPAGGYEWGRPKLILPRWDHALVLRAISELCASAVGPDWESVAARLARYGAWEFDDEQPTALMPEASGKTARAGG